MTAKFKESSERYFIAKYQDANEIDGKG